MLKKSNLCGIQYVGEPGISKHCFDAVLRTIQYGERITHAKILSADWRHCLLLKSEVDVRIAVKSGFSSGYPGEGPRTFAEALWILQEFGVDIDECKVPPKLLERLDLSALTCEDLELIERTEHIRPSRWYDYIYDAGVMRDASLNDLIKKIDRRPDLTKFFEPSMPWAIIDERITDLALKFFDNPDTSIFTGFRRLEDIIRNRTKEDVQSARVYADAFQGEQSPLTWKGLNKSEHNGRAQLFSSTYMAYRNPRAHSELKAAPRLMLTEFLLLNHLYTLERTAIPRVLVERSGAQ